ncbi:hypothetical protein JZ751_010041, partial [Albula glossodonta]
MDRVSSFGLLSLIFIFMSAVFVVKVDAEGLTPLRRQKREWIIPPQKLRENYYYRNVFIAKIRSDTETRTSIRYSLIGKGANMDPVGLFTVDPLNGDVRVNGMLDREETSRYELQGVASFMNGSLAERNLDLVITVEDENDNDPIFQIMHASYTLKVIGSDMNGKTGCRTGTGSVVINLLDVNDNVPTLEKPNYIGIVQENTINVEVMRMKVVDLDIEFINQLSVFTMVSGNEAGYFLITTDEKTNEGVITALDYEELKELDIKVEVRNKATYHSSVQSVGSTAYPIKIKVTNQLEGPKFKPAVKSFTISETSTIHTVIGTYAAIDEDTGKTATNVRSDLPSKTATGTVVIQVEDENDHCPTLPSLSQEVYTSAVLRSHENLWPGQYQLAVEVSDQQGKTCGPQVLDLMVQPCFLGIGGGPRSPPPSPVFGAPGVGFLLLALLLLLLVPLLLMYCTCGGKGPFAPQFPMEPSQHLINYHTEGPGEDQECPRLIVPVEVDGPVITKSEGAGLGAGWKSGCADGLRAQEDQPQIYDYEGDGSAAGSVGCCSDLDVDNDLSFLNDLDIKFKSLAEVCRGSELQYEVSHTMAASFPPQVPVTPLTATVNLNETSASSTATFTHTEVVKEAVLRPPSPAPSPRLVTETSHTVSTTASLPRVHLTENIGVPSPAYLVQSAPVFLAPTPVIQATHYVVEAPQPQLLRGPTLLVTDSGVNQGLVRVDSPGPGPHNLLVVERQVTQESLLGAPQVLVQRTGPSASQNLLITNAGVNQGLIRVDSPGPGSQNLLVVERQVTQESLVGPLQALSRSASPSGTQNLLVTNAGVNQGIVRAESPGPGSHNLLVVESQVTQESLVGPPQALSRSASPSGTQNLLVTDAGVNPGFIRAESPEPGSHNLLVVERQVTQESLVGPPHALSRSASPSGTQNLLVTNAGVNQGFIRAESPEPGSHNLLVVERQVTQESLMGPPQALSRSASPSGTQNLLMTDAGVNQDIVRAESPGSHNLLVVERQVTQESLVGPPQALSRSGSPSGSQNLLVMENSQLLQVREGFPDFKLSPSPDSETQKENTSSSASSQEGAELKMAVSSGAHSMVLQEKQISISEKS